MRALRNAAASEGGFTMMSVMTAMVLMSVGVMAISGAGVFVVGVETEASVRAQALSIGISYMEEVKARSDSLASESPLQVNEAGQYNTSGRFTRTLTVAETAFDEAKKVTITVGYPAGVGRSATLKLETIIYGANE